MKRTLVLENEQPLSWNEFYSGKHWSKRSELAHRCHALVRAALDPEMPMFTKPVRITGTAFYSKDKYHKAVDCDNLFLKGYIDGLIGWVIQDDSPEFVYSVTAVSRVDKNHPRLVLEIEEVDDLPGSKVSCWKCNRIFTNVAALLHHVDEGECGADGWEG